MLTTVLLYPIFYIFIFALLEYILPTRNGALLCSVPIALAVCFLFYRLKKKADNNSKIKKLAKEEKELRIMQIRLSDIKTTEKYLPENSVCDTSFEGITDDKMLAIIKGGKHFDKIYSLNGITDKCAEMLKTLNVEYTLKTQDEMLDALNAAPLPEINIKVQGKGLKLIKELLTSKTFCRGGIKCGITLFLLSLYSNSRVYLAAFGCALIIYSIILRITISKKERKG